MEFAMKRYFIFLLILLSIGTVASAQNRHRDVADYRLNMSVLPRVNLLMNGERMYSLGYLYEGRVLAPARELFETLNAQVMFDPVENEIRVQFREKVMLLRRDDVVMKLIRRNRDVKFVYFDIPVTFYRNVAYVPLRPICDQLDIFLEWDTPTGTVNMITWNPYMIPY